MALVRQRPGTEKPRQLNWTAEFGDSMFVAPHRLGRRLEFYVTKRTIDGQPLYVDTKHIWDKPGGTRWELSTSHNDGTGGKVLHIADNPQACKDFAQTLVNRGE